MDDVPRRDEILVDQSGVEYRVQSASPGGSVVLARVDGQSSAGSPGILMGRWPSWFAGHLLRKKARQ